MFNMKGQGATEYLVLLAVVLMIALVSIALLGFFPGLAGDAKATQSASYWKSARPFGILDVSIVGSTGAASVVIQNNDPDQRTIQSLWFNMSNCSYTGAAVTLNAGEKRTLALVGCPFPAATGSAYELSTNITYNTVDLSGMKQLGTKPVIGKYT